MNNFKKIIVLALTLLLSCGQITKQTISVAPKNTLSAETNSGIKSNESLALAKREGDTLFNILDQFTGEEISLSKIKTTPTVDGIIYFKLGNEYFKRNCNDVYNIKWFGAIGDGITDDTKAINTAFTNYKNILIPAGTWLVDYINVLSNTTIYTDGFKTILKQKPQISKGRRILNIRGGNIVVGDLAFLGNISTDINEQNHAVFIKSDASIGNITNISIGNIRAKNIRGDAVYIGQHTLANTVSNITVGDVVVDNVYRNGVSIVSGNTVKIKSVTGDRVGYFIMDIEPNVGSGVSQNISVGYVKGRSFGLVAPTATDYIDGVTIKKMELNPAYNSQSTPSYIHGIAVEDGLQLRNVKNVTIANLKLSNFNRCGIFTITNTGELGAKNIKIDSLYVRDCSLTDTEYSTFLNLAATDIRVDYLDVVNTQSGKAVIKNLSKGSFSTINATISKGAFLFYYCQNLNITSINQTGAGIFSSALSNSTVKNGTIISSHFAPYAKKCTFKNLKVTANELLFTKGYDDNTIGNCTLNSKYIR